MLTPIIDEVVAKRSLTSLRKEGGPPPGGGRSYHPCSALLNREGDTFFSGSPKSECFLGERKHSEALSFLSKAKKRLAELRADEVVGSSLSVLFS